MRRSLQNLSVFNLSPRNAVSGHIQLKEIKWCSSQLPESNRLRMCLSSLLRRCRVAPARGKIKMLDGSAISQSQSTMRESNPLLQLGRLPFCR